MTEQTKIKFTPEGIARLVLITMSESHPGLDSRSISARTTTFLIETLGFVLINSTLPGPSREKAIEIVCEGIREITK